MSLSKKPRQNSLVELEASYRKWLIANSKTESPLLKGDRFVFLGEIPNMPEHCVVADVASGRVIVGYHVENFVELPVDDV